MSNGEGYAYVDWGTYRQYEKEASQGYQRIASIETDIKNMKGDMVNVEKSMEEIKKAVWKSSWISTLITSIVTALAIAIFLTLIKR